MDSTSLQPKQKTRLRIKNEVGFSGALFAGAFAGLAVDLSLFPLDTLKTRLQSEAGLLKSGGFRNIYAGIPSVAIGSAPGAALFFGSYETAKKLVGPFSPSPAFAHMTAASVGEVFACLVRVPTEVLKQRVQAYPKRTLFYVYRAIRVNEGIRGFYRGYLSTVMREIPFSLIQFPLWEYFKTSWTSSQAAPVTPFQGAICGSVAGVIASGITTPLDVAKTRIMLAERVHGHAQGNVHTVLTDVWHVKGLRGIFAGLFPRMAWMGLGGFIFFGAYEGAKKFFLTTFVVDKESVEMTGEMSLYRYERMVHKFFDRVIAELRFSNAPKTFEETKKVTKIIEEQREDFYRRKDAAYKKFERETMAAYEEKAKIRSDKQNSTDSNSSTL